MKGEGDKGLYIALYVDDLFMVGWSIKEIDKVKSLLKKEFKM